MKKTKIKTIATWFAVLAIPLLVASTCNPQRVAYNSISTVEQTATKSVQAYFSLVVSGKTPTNSVPMVTKAYNNLQAAVVLAATADQAGTNALAPASLQLELNALLNLIVTVEGK